MKTALGLLVLSLALTACTQKTDNREIQIEKVSVQEARAIINHIRTGKPLDERLSPLDDECEAFKASLPSEFTQGYVTVPENWSEPQGRQINVFYYGRLEEGKEPVVFHNGGPASDSHGSYQLLESLPVAHNFSFVYVDQRGTGCSDAFPQEPTAENVQRLTNYTTREIVKDTEAVRAELLGSQPWKVFGQSYGGQIVHRYAIEAPKNLKGAYAHGLSLMDNQNDWLKLRIKSQKRVLEMYLKTYPGDRQKLARIRSLIGESLCFNDGDTKVCGPKVMDALTIYLGFANYWPYMNQTIGSLLSNNQLSLTKLESFVRSYVFGVYNSNGLAANVISVVEMSDGMSDAESCKIVNQKLEAEGETPMEWLINECRLLAGMKNDQWSQLLATITVNKSMDPMLLKTSLQKNPALPFYLYSGEKDVFVPIETFKEEVAALGNLITYRQFPNSGHEGFYTEAQVWSDLAK